RPSSPSARMLSGVLATGYSLRVALLTLTSVACADNNTAISNSNGVLYSSSVRGSGLCSRRRRKISVRFSLFISVPALPGCGHFVWPCTVLCRRVSLTFQSLHPAAATPPQNSWLRAALCLSADGRAVVYHCGYRPGYQLYCAPPAGKRQCFLAAGRLRPLPLSGRHCQTPE